MDNIRRLSQAIPYSTADIQRAVQNGIRRAQEGYSSENTQHQNAVIRTAVQNGVRRAEERYSSENTQPHPDEFDNAPHPDISEGQSLFNSLLDDNVRAAILTNPLIQTQRTLLTVPNPARQRAIEYLEQAANHGLSQALFMLAQMYLNSGRVNRTTTTPPSEETIHTYWLEKAGKSIDGLKEKWAGLENSRNKAQFAEFKTLLLRLSGFLLRDKVSAAEVADVIQAVIESPTIAKLVFDASQSAAEDCAERPLSLFNTVQGLACFGKLEAKGATPLELLSLAKGIARQTLLDEATALVMTKQWEDGRLEGNGPLENPRGTGPNTAEALEYQMALRQALGTELDLPFPVTSVHAEAYINTIVSLTPEDKQLAIDYVTNTMADDKRMIETLVSLPVWEQYMIKTWDLEKAAIDEFFRELMDQLEDEMMEGSKTLEHYLDEVNKLKSGWDSAVGELLQNKTHELCSQVKSV